ncbi:hypothetical protein PC115_g22418 [Phytophthora cactorum]|uniref:PiggyBac transposable element-derived protein domain-containing protein n=1 Tax=Phytophthora cactorum TaxID=29920 RepID=A0A8T1AH39_9STRA|nr:hypothetical protein PC115_g22418 [Phytophthora cactorum]
MFMPDKPHRYGSEMFMVCDSESAYSHRFEIYIGKRQSEDSIHDAFDNKTGDAAVIRNMKVVLGEHLQGFRLVVIDRYYSSVALAIQLLSMSLYVVGTIVTNRLGFDRRVVEKKQTLPQGKERGSFTFSRSIAIPTMIACHWWDRKPAHYLATGPSMAEDSIRRNLKGAPARNFKCPKLDTDYQRWMGGVDVHDQLRLQSYFIETSFRFQKYHKSLFMGLLDMALVNAYITHKKTCAIKRLTPKPRGEWYILLHKQLLQLKAEDFVEVLTPMDAPAGPSRKRRRHAGHKHVQFNDWVTVSEVQKRRQRSCKVYALLRGDRKKSFQTTYYCEDCSKADAKCFL